MARFTWSWDTTSERSSAPSPSTIRAGARSNAHTRIDLAAQKGRAELWTAYRKRTLLRVLDPACAPWCSSSRLWTSWSNERRPWIADLSGNPQTDLFDPVRDVLAHNLYGLTSMPRASVGLLLLWVRTARPGKELSSLEHTLRVGDSLVEDPDTPTWDGPSTGRQRLRGLQDGGFDVVLGNPPYVRMEFLKAVKLIWRRTTTAPIAPTCTAIFRALYPGDAAGRPNGLHRLSTFLKTAAGPRCVASLLGRPRRSGSWTSGAAVRGVTTHPTILTLEKRAPDGPP